MEDNQSNESNDIQLEPTTMNSSMVDMKEQNQHEVTGDNGVKLVNIPPFLNEDPELWFAQIEGYFHINGVTSDLSRFFTVTTSLDVETLRRVSDLVKKPPEDDKYETLKREIIQQLHSLKRHQLILLLIGMDGSNKRPSELLQMMKVLTASHMLDFELQYYWLRKLPKNIQRILKTCNMDDVNKLAKLADSIIDNIPKLQNVDSKTTNTQDDSSVESGLNARITALEESGLDARITALEESGLDARMTALEESLQQVETRLTGLNIEIYNRSSSRQRKRQRSSSKEQVVSQPVIQNFCYYHLKFGALANNCIQPCNFAESQQ
ncbi:uncharacterized protein LOC119681682 [Teleopsis dalmanni]|uniref:uncharacterized protein LOC119681682 n=1 Tax=Teleopsis dalmanni TaxID=139649 RepID=UPI0018CE2E86|nr:uncharacterized protein LOC119681682 [Teleopsis dalmanni]